MKQLLFLLLFPCLALAQYQGNANQKITLGEQTTADGLVWRGVASIDTVTATSKITRANKQDTSAYLLLDTVTNLLWHYKIGSNAWTQAGGGVSVSSFSAGTTGLTPSTATTGAVTLGGTLAVANGGTGADMSSLPNNYLIRKNSSGIFDTAALYEAGGTIGIGGIANDFNYKVNIFGKLLAKAGGIDNAFTLEATSGDETPNFTFLSTTNRYNMDNFSGNFRLFTEATDGTAGEVRMTLTADGKCMIGAGSPSEKLHVVGNARITGAYDVTTASAANVFVTTTGVLQRSTSSIKYKTDVEDYSKGLKEVMQLRPVTFKSINSNNDKTYAGFIAEELADLKLNELVENNDNDEPDAISYAYMVTLLTKAIQEQQEQISQLKKRLLILENK